MSSSEHLDSHDGPHSTGGSADPAGPGDGPGDGRGSDRRRAGWLIGGVVAVLAVAGAGAWAAMSFLSTGPQPAEALPASTLAYASIDLDPSGGQKIEALRTLRKFPSLRDELHLSSTDDVRRLVFEEVQRSGTCPDLDYGDDVEPWLGDRMAIAAVDGGDGGSGPVPVAVLQVSDEGAARTGLDALVACAGPDAGPMAFTVSDGWALIGSDRDVVDRVAAEASKSPLADDADYQHWTEAAGDAGIATFYVSAAAGDALADELSSIAGETDSGMDPGTDPGMGAALGDQAEALSEFGGLGATIRFDDGALELESAGDVSGRAGALGALRATDAGAGDMIRSLPDDTVAALGLGLADGWFEQLVDQMAGVSGSTPEQLMAEVSRETGLDLPADAQTLAGDSVALAVGPGFDPSDLLSSAGTAPDVPVALKVHGDAAGIERVLDKVRGRLGAEAEVLGSSSAGDVVAIGPSEDYRAEVLDDGHLGDSEVFRDVVRESDRAATALFVDFDAGGWLDALTDEDPEVADDLEPLEALGLSVWVDGDTGHAVLRVTTD